VLAEAAAAAVFALSPPPLVLADAAAAAVFARAPPALVLADAAATTVFASTPHPLVLEQRGALRGLLAAEGCGARAVTRPDELAGFTPRSSCLLRFPCGPPDDVCSSSILFLPAAAGSGPSV